MELVPADETLITKPILTSKRNLNGRKSQSKAHLFEKL